MKDCPLGEKCNRNRPIHFQEFSHPHLDAIYNNVTDNNEYDIPTSLCSELIKQQLKLLEALFPKPERATKASNQPTTTTTTTASEEKHSKQSDEAVDHGSSTSSGASSTSQKQQCVTSNPAKKQKIFHDVYKYIPVVIAKGGMLRKLEKAAPYNFFLTTITASRATHHEPLSVTFQELLDESLGEIESSVQINYMIDVGWLLGHYYFAGILDKPLLVLYGDENAELRSISEHKPHITSVKVQMANPFCTSHTKMMLLGYQDGSMRVIISTANLYEEDWDNRVQGIWISPKLPAEQGQQSGESPTGFRADLLAYLSEYKLASLEPWLTRIGKSDFSTINVFFIGSVPGTHLQETPIRWGHARLGQLLQDHVPNLEDNHARIPITCQSSSIGNLGASIDSWLQRDILKNFGKTSAERQTDIPPPFQFIFPSLENVCQSHDGLLGGGCLLYTQKKSDKQPWLKAHLQQWQAKKRVRNQGMPHIKTYARFDVAQDSLYWFVLTSANLSKAAWGVTNKNGNALRISNFEAGVLFLPGFIIGETTFPTNKLRDGMPAFPLPYDLPLTPYAVDDKPFVMDYLQN